MCTAGSCSAAGWHLSGSDLDRYSSLSRNEEIARRTLSPLTQRRGQQMLAATRQAFRDQPIDLTKERFTVYVPGGPPAKEGFGLLVFIAPWSEATRPQMWRPPLSRHGMIFVSAMSSGNDAKVLDRRMPLALLAYEERARAVSDRPEAGLRRRPFRRLAGRRDDGAGLPGRVPRGLVERRQRPDRR